jgi:hypothetical protein
MTTIKQQSTKAMATATGTKTGTEKSKVTAGDVGGGGGDTAIKATATAMAVMVAGSFRRFEVRKANRQIKNLFRCTCTEYYLYE